MNLELAGLDRLAWAQLWQVSLTAVLAGAIARRWGRTRPRLAYALWMLVLVKSMVPPILSSPTSPFSWLAGEPSMAQAEGVGPSRASDFEPGEPKRERNDAGRITAPRWQGTRHLIGPTMLGIWAAGVVLGAGVIAWKQLAGERRIRRALVPVEVRLASSLDVLRRRLGVRRRVRLFVTTMPIGPATFGLFRPFILLPEPLVADMPMEQVKLILAHELIHIRRGDLLAGWCELAAKLAWWFHPLVWWAGRRAGWERERCCDADVVSEIGCTPAQYARTLLSILERKDRLRSLAACPGVRALDVTSLRLESIMKHSGTDDRRAVRLARVAFAAGLFLLIPGAGLTSTSRDEASTGPLPQEAERTLAIADYYLRTGKAASAEFYLGKVLLRFELPEDVRRTIVLANSHIRNGDLAAAKGDLAKARADHPRPGPPHGTPFLTDQLAPRTHSEAGAAPLSEEAMRNLAVADYYLRTGKLAAAKFYLAKARAPRPRPEPSRPSPFGIDWAKFPTDLPGFS